VRDGWAAGKTKGFIKTKSLGWRDRWMDGRRVRDGWMDGRRVTTRGEYRFSSLMK
jgi:hypothetical protein